MCCGCCDGHGRFVRGRSEDLARHRQGTPVVPSKHRIQELTRLHVLGHPEEARGPYRGGPGAVARLTERTRRSENRAGKEDRRTRVQMMPTPRLKTRYIAATCIRSLFTGRHSIFHLPRPQMTASGAMTSLPGYIIARLSQQAMGHCNH